MMTQQKQRYSLHRKLNQLISGTVLTHQSDCYTYAYGSHRVQMAPNAVVFPMDREDVMALVRWAREEGMVLTARGQGNSHQAGLTPTQPHIMVSFEHMKRVLVYSPSDQYIQVEPGLNNHTLQAFTQSDRLFWPPNPSSQMITSIGGNLSYNAAGPYALKYGPARHNTLGLGVVLGTGEYLQTGLNSHCANPGYDLTRLIIGSEGTLGLITDATLQLHPIAPHRHTLLLWFKNQFQAAEHLGQIIRHHEQPCSSQFLDETAVQLLKQYSRLNIPQEAHAALLLEYEGYHEVALQYTTEAILKQTRPLTLQHHLANTTTQSKQLWQHYKALAPIIKHAAPHRLHEDITVPLSQVTSLLIFLHAKASPCQVVCHGHLASGHLNVNILYTDLPGSQEHAHALMFELFQKVIGLGGHVSSEYSISSLKKPFSKLSLDPKTRDAMAQLKNTFDPDHVLNPTPLFSN